jgi:hypothetical protein
MTQNLNEKEMMITVPDEEEMPTVRPGELLKLFNHRGGSGKVLVTRIEGRQIFFTNTEIQ